MSTVTIPGASGIIQNEPLLWEKGGKGRRGMCVPASDVPAAELPAALCRGELDFPELSEVDVVRHYTRLSQWNFGVDSGMYPLGSCTMKYNPKINEKAAATPALAAAHPMLPDELVQGSLQVMHELQSYLAAITGLPAVTLQPAAGAHGELTGMLLIRAYHTANGNPRSKVLIPDSAHGTNPASAAICHYEIVTVKSGADGLLDPDAVRAAMDDEVAAIDPVVQGISFDLAGFAGNQDTVGTTGNSPAEKLVFVKIMVHDGRPVGGGQDTIAHPDQAAIGQFDDIGGAGGGLGRAIGAGVSGTCVVPRPQWA